MRLSLDGKSLAVGLFAGAASVAAFGAAQNSSVGRFAIAATRGEGPDSQVYVIDTTTAEVWEVEKIGTRPNSRR